MNTADTNIPCVAVTVVTYNRPDLTLRCLRSLREKTTRPFTLAVVDNGSEEPLRRDLLALRAEGLVDALYLNRRNMGVSVAANLGWAQTDADYYIKLDNDIIIQNPSWLDELVDLAAEGGFAATACRLCAWHQTTPARLPGGRAYQATGAVGGGCVCIPRAAHETLGFWNEDYLYGWEDLEYGNRAVQAGFALAYTADEDLVLHAGPPVDNALAAYQNAKTDRTLAASGPAGLFLLNMAMFEMKLRPLYVTRKFIPEIEGSHGIFQVRYRLDPAYAPIVTRQNLFRERFIAGYDGNDLYLKHDL